MLLSEMQCITNEIYTGGVSLFIWSFSKCTCLKEKKSYRNRLFSQEITYISQTVTNHLAVGMNVPYSFNSLWKWQSQFQQYKLFISYRVHFWHTRGGRRRCGENFFPIFILFYGQNCHSFINILYCVLRLFLFVLFTGSSHETTNRNRRILSWMNSGLIYLYNENKGPWWHQWIVCDINNKSYIKVFHIGLKWSFL